LESEAFTSPSNFGTTAAEHAAEDTVQRCENIDNENVVDMMQRILIESGIDSTYIPTTDWQAERDQFFGNIILTRTITPIETNKLLNELQDQFGIQMFWDEVNRKINLLAIKPTLGVTTTITDDHIVQNTFSKKEITNYRTSRVYIRYLPRNDAEWDKRQDFDAELVYADADPESDNAYGEQRITHINSRWIRAGGVALQTSGRRVVRFKNNLIQIEFELDVKDATLVPGDVFQINTKYITDESGANINRLFQVLRVQEIKAANRFQYLCNDAVYEGNYRRIGPNSLGTYTSESEANKTKYMAICNNSNQFSNGDTGHQFF